MKRIILLCMTIPLYLGVYCQTQLVDKIIAQVNDKIILKSDIEIQYQNAVAQGGVDESTRCRILTQMLAEKILITQAERDSIVVSEEEVESELEQRIRYFISLLGSQEKLEAYYKKSVLQMKEDFRDDIQNLVLARKMQSTITGNVSISPAEVKTFFKKIPEDSLPYFNAEVQLSHLVIKPIVTQEQKEIAREKIADLRDRIINGDKFEDLAVIYSEDPGSAEEGGYLDCVSRGEMVPEFEAAAFKLKEGEISEVVETQFGYHIIKMLERKGEKACISHILVQPKITNINLKKAERQIDSIKALIDKGRYTFSEAVEKFSMDDFSASNGGDIINEQSASTYFGIDELESETYYAIEQLEPGQISSAVTYEMADGTKAYRLILLKSETEPHKANLRQDYSKIQDAAKNEKMIRLMDEWLESRVVETYIRIDETYLSCEGIDKWLKVPEQYAEPK